MKSCVDVPFRLVVGVEGDRPWEMLRIGEARRAGRGQKLRHFFLVQIFLDRGIGWRADDLEGGKNFVSFDKLAHLLDRLWRTVAIVVLNEIDLAPVDSTLLVDHADIGGLHLADAAVGGSRSTERNGLTDLDLRIGRTGVIFLLCERGRCECRAECQHESSRRPENHAFLPKKAVAVLRRTVVGEPIPKQSAMKSPQSSRDPHADGDDFTRPHPVRRHIEGRAFTGSSSDQSPCSSGYPFGNGGRSSNPSERTTRSSR